MKNILLKIQRYGEKKRYELILHGRSYLTDYEKDQLIPELRSRLNVLKQYFNEIIELCDLQKGSQEFNQNLNSIINPTGLANSPSSSGQSISRGIRGIPGTHHLIQ